METQLVQGEDNFYVPCIMALNYSFNFLNEELMPEATWVIAEEIAMDIDIDDVGFIALPKHLKGHL